MKITCPSCDTSYQLPDGAVGDRGRKVKCATCGFKWQVHPAAKAEAMSNDPVLDSISTGVEDVPQEWREESANESRATSAPGNAVENGETNEEVTISPKAKEALPKAKNPINPLLRTANIQSRTSKLTQERSEDIRRARHVRVLRPTIFLATLGLVAGLIAIREPVSRVFPDLASLYATVGAEVNLSGFAIKNVKSERVIESDGPVLIVSGEIENLRTVIQEAPRLRFGLKTNTHEEIYAWEHRLSVPTIVPGGTARFQSRLPAPPTLGRNLSVRFTNDAG